MTKLVLSNSTFYSLWIPISFLVFFSLPLTVLYQSSQYFPEQSSSTFTTFYKNLKFLRPWWEKYNTQDGKEIPLLFVLDEYPSSGVKKFKIHEKKYMELAETLEKQKEVLVGYVHIFNGDYLKDKLPKGELIEITHFEWTQDGCILTTRRKCSFRINELRQEKTSGIFYGSIQTEK